MTGKISLVGAGLGSPELLTVRALRRLKEADVVVYDRLINPALLNACKSDCEKIYVGKNPAFHPIPQKEIEKILVAKAREGKLVVRLKSGDPYVFGRGGEEGAVLKSEGIPFEVVPGITSAIGGLAYGGIPITHRDYASSFHIYTGHLKTEEPDIDWQTAAKAEGTLVFLMGMSELHLITEQLIQHGKSPACPSAIIQWAGRKNQRTVTGTLGSIEKKAQKAGLGPPSLIVIGEVAGLREQLNFFEAQPLFGKSVTLPWTAEKRMFSKLTDLGAEVFELPAPVTENFPAEFLLKDFQEFVFLDPQSVVLFAKEMLQQRLDWRSLSMKRIISAGKQTALQLTEQGLQPDEEHGTAEMLSKAVLESAGTLFVGEAVSLGDLHSKTDFSSRQWMTHSSNLVLPEDELWLEADYFFFPSSKSATLFVKALKEKHLKILRQKKIFVMGEATKSVFDRCQLPVAKSAEATFESVIASMNLATQAEELGDKL